MAERTAQTVVTSSPVVDWCPRCNLSRVTTEIWVLTPNGMYKTGHGIDCGCYR